MYKALCLLIFITSLSGCQVLAPIVQVNVNSISAPSSNFLKSYILLPLNKGVTVDDLQFQEYANYVDKALKEQGFTKAINFNDANVAIFLGYGIGEPKSNQYTYNVPVRGVTGITASNTHSTVNVYGNTATVSSNTTYTPTYGVTGTKTETITYTTYTRFLSINAIELNQYKINQQQKEVWKTNIVSTGSSGDLRQIFPILVAASKPYISKNTGKIIEVQIKEEDERVLAIKGIAAN